MHALQAYEFQFNSTFVIKVLDFPEFHCNTNFLQFSASCDI